MTKPFKHFLVTLALFLSIYDAGPAYPGDVVVEACKSDEETAPCIRLRINGKDLEKPGTLDDLTVRLRKLLEEHS